MCWRDHFVFCAEAIYKAQAVTGEIKGHYLNATASTCEEMIKRAVQLDIENTRLTHGISGFFCAQNNFIFFCFNLYFLSPFVIKSVNIWKLICEQQKKCIVYILQICLRGSRKDLRILLDDALYYQEKYI